MHLRSVVAFGPPPSLLDQPQSLNSVQNFGPGVPSFVLHALARPGGREPMAPRGHTLLPLPTLTRPHTMGDTISRWRENFELRWRRRRSVTVFSSRVFE